MPSLELRGARIHYEFAGPDSAPMLVLSNSLGTNLAMWDPQLAVFARHFRVLRYDTRGHGQSSVMPGPYSIEQLADDVIAMLDGLGIDRVSFCGLSMGGMIGMSLGLRVPYRLQKLVACSTAPKIGTIETWNTRIETVRRGGMKAVVDAVLERWYTPAFRDHCPEAIESTRRMLLQTPVEGYAACCAAVRDMDQRSGIAAIRVPTLVVAGAHDPVAPPAEARFLVEHIACAQYLELPAAHLSNIEAAEAFTMGVSQFLTA